MQLSGEIEKSNFRNTFEGKEGKRNFRRNLGNNFLYQCLDIDIIQRLLSTLKSFQCKK